MADSSPPLRGTAPPRRKPSINRSILSATLADATGANSTDNDGFKATDVGATVSDGSDRSQRPPAEPGRLQRPPAEPGRLQRPPAEPARLHGPLAEPGSWPKPATEPSSFTSGSSGGDSQEPPSHPPHAAGPGNSATSPVMKPSGRPWQPSDDDIVPRHPIHRARTRTGRRGR